MRLQKLMAKQRKLRSGETEEMPKAKLTWFNLQRAFRLFSFIRPRWKFFLGIFFLAGTAAVALGFPVKSGELIGLFGDTSLSAEKAEQEMKHLLLYLIGILLIQGVFSFGRVLMFTQVAENMLFGIRSALFTNLMRLPMSFYSKSHASELNSRVSADINVIGEAFTISVAELIRQTVIVIGGTIALFIYGKSVIAVKFLLIIPPIAFITVFFARKIRKFSKELQDKIAQSNVVVGEAVSGISNVKSFTNENYEVGRYLSIIQQTKIFAYRYGLLRGAFFTFIITCLFGGIIYVIWSLFLLKMQGELDSYSLGKFLMLSMFVAASIGGLPEQIAAVQRAIGATERVFELMEMNGEDVSFIETDHFSRLQGKIEFNSVSFFYPSRLDFQVLDNVTFTASKGETIALVGPSGSGKSTITNLILRFYNPVQGSILFDDKLANGFSLTELRRNMAIVPQDVILFSGTIKDNIEYGKPGASMEEIRHAARQANALEFIDSFPQQFDTLVGDRGIQLSGGQRQRIAIARAVLKNPSILILDEATSSLDSESEKMVQDALDKLMKDRTSIVIAHRLSTIRNADKIVVLEKGRVKETGTHDELMSMPDGLYRSLSILQTN